MASFHAAGYLSFKPAANPSSRMSRAFDAPQFRPAAVLDESRGALNDVSGGLCDSACEAHRFELEELDRRIDAARLLKDTVLGLKDRLARRVMMRAPLAVVEDAVELSYKAS